MIADKKVPDPKPKQNAPKIPESPPGRFCLLKYLKDREMWRIVVDDESKSSYILESIESAMGLFRAWRHERSGNEALDIAREFGAAQLIFSDERVIPVSPYLDVKDANGVRQRTGTNLAFDESGQNAPVSLPSLGSQFSEGSSL